MDKENPRPDWAERRAKDFMSRPCSHLLGCHARECRQCMAEEFRSLAHDCEPRTALDL